MHIFFYFRDEREYGRLELHHIEERRQGWWEVIGKEDEAHRQQTRGRFLLISDEYRLAGERNPRAQAREQYRSRQRQIPADKSTSPAPSTPQAPTAQPSSDDEGEAVDTSNSRASPVYRAPHRAFAFDAAEEVFNTHGAGIPEKDGARKRSS